MEACLARLPPGMPVCSLGKAPGAPGGWLLSRCAAGRAPILVELPAAEELAEPDQEQTTPPSCQVTPQPTLL